MNAKTLEAIQKHGNSLLTAFPNATEKDPVALCKKLRRVETALTRPILEYCNTGNNRPELDTAEERALLRVRDLLGITEHQASLILFVNTDPRGYALKLRTSFTNGYNSHLIAEGRHELTIYRDLGGYGIIAPDLNTK